MTKKINPIVREFIEIGNNFKGNRVGSKDIKTVKENVTNVFNKLTEKNND